MAGTRTIDVAAGEGVTGGTQGDGVVTLGGLQSGGARAAQFQAVDLRFAGGGIIGTIQQGGRADHGGCAGGADWAVGKRFTGVGFIEADTARGRFEAHLRTIVVEGHQIAYFGAGRCGIAVGIGEGDACGDQAG